MPQPQEKSKNDQPIEAKSPAAKTPLSLIQTSTLVYTSMAAIGVLVSLHVHNTLPDALTLTLERDKLLSLLAVSGLAAGVLIISSYLFEGWFQSFLDVKRMVTGILGNTNAATAFYLALLSSVGEELLFRGAIQPFAGLLITSILFGLLHMGPDGRLSSWSLWAFLAGLLLGWIYEATGSLWPPVAVHFCMNFFSMLRLQRDFRHITAQLAVKQAHVKE